MSLTKRHYHDEILAQSDLDDTDFGYWEWTQEERERELDGLGTSDEPQRDVEFDMFEGSCESGLRCEVLNLLGIGWTVERVTAVVLAAARDAA